MNFAFLKRSLSRLSWRLRPRDQRLALGRRGERAAARFLRRRGYLVLQRNYRCPAGEIDLICADGESLVFVEVKTRTSDEAEDLHEALRAPQWRRIENAARYFVMERSAQHRPCRFDLVTVLWPAKGKPIIEHFIDAFHPRKS